jgi:hypothetical protein
MQPFSSDLTVLSVACKRVRGDVKRWQWRRAVPLCTLPSFHGPMRPANPQAVMQGTQLDKSTRAPDLGIINQQHLTLQAYDLYQHMPRRTCLRLCDWQLCDWQL